MTVGWTCKDLPGGFGIEILGANLARSLSASESEAIRRLFRDKGLIVFREQKLTVDEQVKVMSCIGPVIDPRLEPDHYITNQPGSWKGPTQSAELCWHSDNAFFEEPAAALSLHAVEVVDGASTTRFASGRNAYRRLPAKLREKAETLQTMHIFPHSVSLREQVGELPEDLPSHVRPLVLRQEGSETPYVYLSLMMIHSIVNLSPAESEELIGEVCEHFFSPDNVYVHAWNNGDLVIWDNMTFQHARGNIAAVGPRVLQKALCVSQPTIDRYPARIRNSILSNSSPNLQMFSEGKVMERSKRA